MKAEVVFLTILLMVVYVVSEHQDDSFTMCTNVKGEVEFLSILSLQESFRAFEVLSNTIRPHFTGTDSECLNDAFNNYVTLWREDIQQSDKCPRAARKDNTMECVHASVKRLDCILKSAKNKDKITAQVLDHYSNCSNYLGDSKIAKIISAKVNLRYKASNRSASLSDSKIAEVICAQRSELVYDKTIIYKMEEAQRKYKEEKIW